MTTKQPSAKAPIIGRVGAILALLSFLFLPIAGCQEVGVNGMEAMKSNDVSSEIKIFVVLCIAFAAIGIVAKPSVLCFLTGIGGIAAILIGYAIARNDLPVKLMAGSYFAIIGFVAILIEGFKQIGDQAGAPTVSSDGDKPPD